MCSAVGIVRGYGLDGPGLDYRQEQETFVKTFTQLWLHPAPSSKKQIYFLTKYAVNINIPCLL
jgi:hypothetical protein